MTDEPLSAEFDAATKWQTQLDLNPLWIAYQKTSGFLERNGFKQSPKEHREKALKKVVTFITDTLNQNNVAALGAQAFDYTVTETKWTIEEQQNGLAAQEYSLGGAFSNHSKKIVRSGIADTKSQISDLGSEIDDIAKAKEKVTNEEFGVALLAKMVLKLRKSGFNEEARYLRAQLDAAYDVPAAVAKTLGTNVTDIFALDSLKQVKQPKAAAPANA